MATLSPERKPPANPTRFNWPLEDICNELNITLQAPEGVRDHSDRLLNEKDPYSGEGLKAAAE
jgi:hypothetical protein